MYIDTNNYTVEQINKLATCLVGAKIYVYSSFFDFEGYV